MRPRFVNSTAKYVFLRSTLQVVALVHIPMTLIVARQVIILCLLSLVVSTAIVFCVAVFVLRGRRTVRHNLSVRYRQLWLYLELAVDRCRLWLWGFFQGRL